MRVRMSAVLPGLGGAWQLFVAEQAAEAVRSKEVTSDVARGIERAVFERAQTNGTVTREEVAAFLRVSTKKIQRMDAQGRLPRCPHLDGVVRYRARDVLRLASASGKED